MNIAIYSMKLSFLNQCTIERTNHKNMEGKITITKKIHQTNQNFVDEVEASIYDLLKRRIKILGLDYNDLTDPTTILKYEIGREEIVKPQEYVIVKYRAMGVNLIETTWFTSHVLVGIPDVEPDYSDAKEWIASYIPKDNN
jgi:hypothetical protein